MTTERVSAERTECLHRIDQRATVERVEGEKRQVTLSTASVTFYELGIRDILGSFFYRKVTLTMPIETDD